MLFGNYHYFGDDVIKCSLLIENVQPLLIDGSPPILNIRYWPTEHYQTRSFNYYN